MRNRILIGCVADDFTGASDAASFLLSQGIKTLLLNGVPDSTDGLENCNAVVIALKSRTQETKKAVADTMQAFYWLKERGAEHFYFKYCSTFDSTKKGNIGPVVDTLLEEFEEKYTILCPALPINKRTVENGMLFVDGIPLHESHMKNHPLTPMWDASLAELMKPQGKYDTLNINKEALQKSREEIEKILKEFGRNREHFYVVPDYSTEEDGNRIAELFSGQKILTGGSGILAPLAKIYKKTLKEDAEEYLESNTKGNGIVLAGSCSKATLGQIADFQKKGFTSYKINPQKVLDGTETLETVWQFVKANIEKEILIYSSDTAEAVMEIQKEGKEKIAELLENIMAELAERVVKHGFTRIIVAGGETSSAVAKKLGYHSFVIGESIAPGVPVMAPVGDKSIRIVLKSGNFGQEDFFERALNKTRKG